MGTAPEDLAKAVEHFRGGRVPEALALAGRHEIENALGTEDAKRGDLEGAERHYQEATRREPGFFKPHNNLGNVLCQRGDLEGAVAQYRAALGIEPSAQRVHANLGNTLFDLGLWLDAVAAYRKAVALGAGAEVALRLAQALDALGDAEEARVALGRAAELGAATKGAAGLPRAFAGRQRPLVEAGGEEIEALLAPVSPATFVRDFWGKKPLFVKGSAAKYRGFFDADAFAAALASPVHTPPEHLRASFDKRVDPKPGGAPENVARLIPVAPEHAGLLHAAGATICVTEIERRVPHLAAFLAAVQRGLGYPGKIAFNAYASPPGAGFNWHFDARIASTLQIEGTKRWRFSRRPAVPWPRGNGVRRTDGSSAYGDAAIARADWERLEPLDEADILTVVLEPGDLLVLPAGVWHDAQGGAEGSLALNLAFLPVSHTRLVEEILDEALAHDPAWRSASPLLRPPASAPGVVDTGGIAALQAQIERAADALRALAADPARLIQAWSSLVQGAEAEPPAGEPSAGPAGTPRGPARGPSRENPG